jgi:hypothetical protein
VTTAGEMIENSGQATQGIVTSLLYFVRRYRYCITFRVTQLAITSLLKKLTRYSNVVTCKALLSNTAHQQYSELFAVRHYQHLVT